MSGCCKCVLIVLNGLILIAALTLVGLLLWVKLSGKVDAEIDKLEKEYTKPEFVKLAEEYEELAEEYDELENPASKYKEIVAKIRLVIDVAVWVLIGFGAAGAIIALVGIIGACCSSRCLVGFYAVLLLLLVLAECAVGVFIIVYRPKVKDEVSMYVKKTLEAAENNAYGSEIAEFILDEFKCCGVSTDKERDSQCDSNKKPCDDVIWDTFDFWLMVTGLITLAIVLVQVTALIFALLFMCCKSCSSRK